jgi:RimJ/RimL family protein N-acetyltransferase
MRPVDLELRPFREQDAAALNRAVQESREHLRPWLPWASEPPMTDATRRAWIADRRREAQAGGDETLGLWLGERCVGSIGLHDRIGPGALEIGYWVHVDFTRRGIATEAVRRVCERAFARPSIHHVEIHHDPANEASGSVAAAAGFRLASESATERIWRLDRRR